LGVGVSTAIEIKKRQALSLSSVLVSILILRYNNCRKNGIKDERTHSQTLVGARMDPSIIVTQEISCCLLTSVYIISKTIRQVKYKYTLV
ncbi:hypothetical protein COD14_07685, partial [Bacillus cereus]